MGERISGMIAQTRKSTQDNQFTENVDSKIFKKCRVRLARSALLAQKVRSVVQGYAQCASWTASVARSPVEQESRDVRHWRTLEAFVGVSTNVKQCVRLSLQMIQPSIINQRQYL